MFLGVWGRSPRCASSHICVHLCLACPSIPGCLCPYISAFLYPSYSASWDCGPWSRHNKPQLRLVSPLPRLPPPLASSPMLGSTDPSRRLIAGAVAAIFSLSAPLPSPTQACWGSGEDRLSLGSLTGWGSEEKGELEITDRCRATPWDRLGFLGLKEGLRLSFLCPL